MRFLFVATGEIAIPSFRKLIEGGPRPLALITQPDKPVGRRQILTPPRIKLEAEAAGISVWQPEKIGDLLPEIVDLKVDLLVVMAYGQILRKDLLDLPGLTVINLHASLLPKYRGASCIQAAIDAGDEISGLTAMHLELGLDSGDVILTEELRLDPDETGGSLHDRLAELAPCLLLKTLAQLSDGSAQRTPQLETLATYAPKLHREHGRLDWQQPAAALERRIRAYDPWPNTFAEIVGEKHTRRLKIFPPVARLDPPSTREPGTVEELDGVWLVHCGQGALALSGVQLDGSKRMPAENFFLGQPARQLT